MSAAAEQKPELRKLSLFGTPLAVHLLPEAPSLNALIAPTLTSLVSGAPAGPGEGWQGDVEPAGPAAEAIGSLITWAVSLAEAMSAARPEGWSHRLALEVLRPGQGRSIGSVPEALWCARYVLDDGGAAAKRDLGARFEAQDPRGVGPVMYAPHLSIAGPAGPTLGISQTIGLRSGAMMVYPGWLLHGMEPYRGPEAHVSLIIRLLR